MTVVADLTRESLERVPTSIPAFRRFSFGCIFSGGGECLDTHRFLAAPRDRHAGIFRARECPGGR